MARPWTSRAEPPSAGETARLKSSRAVESAIGAGDMTRSTSKTGDASGDTVVQLEPLLRRILLRRRISRDQCQDALRMPSSSW